MQTYMANPDKIERKWYVVDAEGCTLGRLASGVASVLRGKNKPQFTPHVDTGDYVIVVNADKMPSPGLLAQASSHYVTLSYYIIRYLGCQLFFLVIFNKIPVFRKTRFPSASTPEPELWGLLPRGHRLSGSYPCVPADTARFRSRSGFRK